MKNLIITTIVFLLLVSNSIAKIPEDEQKVLIHYLRSSSGESLEKQMDMNDLNGCPILIKNMWDGYDAKNGPGVDQTLLKGKWRTERGISLDSESLRSNYLSNSWKVVYIGSWQYIEKLDIKVRLVTMQHINSQEKSGALRNYFESMNNKNKKLPSMLLKLVKPTYGDELCILKWHHKYGYNAIAENYRRLRPGFWNWLFRNYELVITGKIIEIKE